MNTNQMSRRREERPTEIDTVKVGIGIDRPVYAQILNMSNNGLCLETDLYLEKGQHLYIYPTLSTSVLDKRHYGEVRWRLNINDSFFGRYRYGILSLLNQ